MEIPLQISSKDIELTGPIRKDIEEKANKLEKFYSRITRCRVVVESPQRSSRQGKLYNVRIDITVPGGEIVIKREPNEDLYVSIRDSFKAARRKLEDFNRKQRGDVKHHEEVPLAQVSTIFHDKGYGFITTKTGREIYFHENSVINSNFMNLQPGHEVRYVEAEGEKGPQASTISVLD